MPLNELGKNDFVIHQDHVYLPALQPRVTAARVVLESVGGRTVELMRDGDYVIDFGA